MMKTAVALAAFTESRRVLPFHVHEAARLVLPHRMNQGLLRDMERAGDHIDKLFKAAVDGGPAPEKIAFADLDEKAPAPLPDGEVPPEYTEEFGLDPSALEEMQVPGAMAAGSVLFTFLKKKLLTAEASPKT
jgi:hypothetical protein